MVHNIDDATAREINARLCPGPYLPKETLSVRHARAPYRSL